jgi:pentalenolactone synthase
MQTEQDLPRLPFPVPDVTDIAPRYRALHAEQPINPVRTAAGDVAWLVTGYHEVKALFGDERLGRTHPDPDRAARNSQSVLGAPMGNYETEKEDHDRLRRLLAPAFSARRMQAMRQRVEEITEDLLDRLATLDRPADLHEELSYPLPIMVICELLGVPFSDHEKIRDWSAAVGRVDDREWSATALGELMEYMFGLIEEKQRCPADDVLSEMVAAESNWGQIVLMAAMLLFAGHETTVARIDFGALLLLSDRARWEAVRDDPTLIPGAVEEILRFSSPGGSLLTRYARTDIDVAGTRVRAGEAVLLAAPVANRDERAFADPDRFDITRQTNQHIAFGHGRHFCVGAGLARIELQTVFGALVKRFPTLRLAVPQEKLRLRGEAFTGGLTELPVTW